MKAHPKGWGVASCPDAHCDYKFPYLIASKAWGDLADMALLRHMNAKGHEYPQTQFGLGGIFNDLFRGGL